MGKGKKEKVWQKKKDQNVLKMNVDFYLRFFFIAFCKSYLALDNFLARSHTVYRLNRNISYFFGCVMNVSLLLLLFEGTTESSIYGHVFVATGYYTFFKWLLKSRDFPTN